MELVQPQDHGDVGPIRLGDVVWYSRLLPILEGSRLSLAPGSHPTQNPSEGQHKLRNVSCYALAP